MVNTRVPLKVGAAKAYGPAVTVTRRASDKLREGHLWVYRSDVAEVTPGLEGGGIAAVVDQRGIPLGSALFSDASEITLRMVSGEAGMTRASYLESVAEKVGAALGLRRAVSPECFDNPSGTNGLRLIFSEGDGLPGIVADKYGSLVVVQLLTQGTAQDDIRSVLVAALRDGLGDAGLVIVERPDPKVRELEKLDLPPAGALYGGSEEGFATVFSLNGLKLHFDAGAGQKTGAFLDQRLNYAAAARYARGSALDVCTYQGGFALHMAQVCDAVTGVDASRSALEVADRNRALNPQLRAQVDWIEADAFELLREMEASGQGYDTIVLDPPAFAKSRRAVEGALRGYKELNLRAMKMVSAGGTLVTCSCSHHVALVDFMEMVRSAAIDAGKRVQVLETRGAAPDHPSVVTLPETDYLKCVVLRVG